MDLPKVLTQFEPTANGCFAWTGYRDGKGYGRVYSPHAPSRLAHRAIYIILNGDPGLDKDIDHICRNTSCVNPAHLEAVTPAENQRRRMVALRERETCNHGHSLSVYGVIVKRRNRTGEFTCHRCILDRKQRSYIKARLEGRR